MDEARVPSNSSIPLVSRLDHLEFLMKYLEREQKWGSNAPAQKQCMPLDLAVKDAYFKGSLLDRVASLEHRLFQLCLDMDSSCNSNPLSCASTQTSGESSSSQWSKGYSLPTFTPLPYLAEKAKSQSQLSLTLVMQDKSERVQKQVKDPSSPQQQVAKSKAKRSNEKTSKDKKRTLSTWPLLKLLGCS